MKMYSPAAQKKYSDAEDLALFFKRYLNSDKRLERKSHLRQRAPYNLRREGCFHAALDELVKQNRVRLVRYGRDEYVDFQPSRPLPPSAPPSSGRE